MFRKTLFLLLLLPMIGAAIIMSCGKSDAYICGIQNFDIEMDTVSPLTKPMTIVIEAYQKVSSNCYVPGIRLINAAYAMQPPCVKWRNDINWGTIKMSFDKPLPMSGDTLHAGTNFLEHPLINGKNKFKKTTGCWEVTYKQELSGDIVKKIGFDTGAYQVSVHFETTDSRIVDQVFSVKF